MKKNPFSIYDFLGYVFPGAFTIVVFCFIFQLKGGLTMEYFFNFIDKIKENFSWEDSLWFILLAYVVGHIVSYASSLTIEPFSVWKYGYPSSFLLGQNHDGYFPQLYPFSWDTTCIFMWKGMVALVVLPIAICCLILGDLFRLRRYSLKRLDNYLSDSIIRKLNFLVIRLDLQNIPEGQEVDLHRIIYHYEYEKKNAHNVKMDNYVALYGFMRAITFVVNCCCLYAFYYSMRNELNNIRNYIFLLGLVALTYFFFLAFMKFYRRFTLESFMCLVTDDDLKEIE